MKKLNQDFNKIIKGCASPFYEEGMENQHVLVDALSRQKFRIDQFKAIRIPRKCFVNLDITMIRNHINQINKPNLALINVNVEVDFYACMNDMVGFMFKPLETRTIFNET